MSGQATAVRATPENTGPGAMLTDGEALFEVTDERRRTVKAGERRLSILERRVLDCAKPTTWTDPKGWTRDRGGAWTPMVELRSMVVVREAESPAAAESPDEAPVAE